MRCAIYARYSSDQQKPTSIDDQIRECADAAAEHGWTVLSNQIYVDQAVSAASGDRPGLKKLLSAANTSPRPFDILLLDDTSRLSRNLSDSSRFVQELQFLGIRVRAISQGIDSQDEQSEVLWTVHGLVDSLYLKELAKKTHRGLEGAVRRQLHAGGRCFGYQNVRVADGVELQINEGEATIVRRIFQMAAQGHSLKDIAKSLNADGIQPPRPRSGKLHGGWCPTAIREMLRRELYAGRQIWNRSVFVKRPGTNKRVRRDRPPNEWVAIERPDLRIVEDELWSKVQRRLADLYAVYGVPNRKGLLHRAASSSYLLTGVAKCGMCGANIVIVTGRGSSGHAKYGCPHNFYRGTCGNGLRERHDHLEERLLEGLQTEVLKPEVVDFVVEEFGRQLQQALASLSDDLVRLRGRKKELEAEIRRLTDAIAAGGHTDALLTAIGQRQNELHELDRRLLSEEPFSVESRVKEIRSFVVDRLRNIRDLLCVDVVAAKKELLKHVSEVRLLPDGKGPIPHYVAEGAWNLLGSGEQRDRMVAGVGFEPTTFGL